jgi:hypothetical protein
MVRSGFHHIEIVREKSRVWGIEPRMAAESITGAGDRRADRFPIPLLAVSLAFGGLRSIPRRSKWLSWPSGSFEGLPRPQA